MKKSDISRYFSRIAKRNKNNTARAANLAKARAAKAAKREAAR